MYHCKSSNWRHTEGFAYTENTNISTGHHEYAIQFAFSPQNGRCCSRPDRYDEYCYDNTDNREAVPRAPTTYYHADDDFYDGANHNDVGRCVTPDFTTSTAPRDDNYCFAAPIKTVATARRRSRRRTIEIVPGLDVALRGADESFEALRRGFFIPSVCVCCSTVAACIEDADYLLCPDCKTISPVSEVTNDDDSSSRSRRRVGGVGLGVRFDTLFRDQAAYSACCT